MTSDHDAAIEARAREAVAQRVRAALRLISPEHITPIGRRQIELALQDESPSNGPIYPQTEDDSPASRDGDF